MLYKTLVFVNTYLGYFVEEPYHLWKNESTTSSLDLFQTFSSCVQDNQSAIRFLETQGIIRNQRLCRNGHEIYLSTSLDRWKRSYFPWGKLSCASSIYMDYIQQAANHTTSFVEPGCGAHIQTIESFWLLYKMQKKRHCWRHHRKQFFEANAQRHERILSSSVTNKTILAKTSILSNFWEVVRVFFLSLLQKIPNLFLFTFSSYAY